MQIWIAHDLIRAQQEKKPHGVGVRSEILKILDKPEKPIFLLYFFEFTRGPFFCRGGTYQQPIVSSTQSSRLAFCVRFAINVGLK